MAIADTINSMKTNITNAYNAIQTKGGTVPTNKNLANLSTAINSIPAGGSGGIEEVSTVAALKAKVTAKNVGKFYKYTGTTSDGFENNELYQVVRDTSGGSNYNAALGLGKVSVNFDKYTITYNYTACGDDFPVTSMPSLGGRVTGNIYTALLGPEASYVLPDTITVTGCQYTWTLDASKKTGFLELYNATGNITVTIIAHADYGETPTYGGLWNLFGDNNFRGAKNSSNVFDDIGFMSDFISNYSKISGGATSYWTQFIKDLSAAGDIVKSAVENKGLTDKDVYNIIQMIKKAFYGVSLTVNFATTSAIGFMESGYMEMKVKFEKNVYKLYLWLKTVPYAPLD